MTSAPLAHADVIKEQAADFLQRREFWPWNEQDQIQLRAWRAQSSAHDIAFLRMEATWDRTSRLKALRQRARQPMRQPPPRKSRLTDFALRAAAAFVAIIALAFVVLPNLPQEKGDLYTTPIGGRATIALSDGSQVHLNTNTALRIGSKKRTATLISGEAYFDIRHNPDQPFIVTTPGHRVVDLGTKFSLRTDGDKLHVALVEGLARIDNTQNKQTPSITIKPGDTVLATTRKTVVTRSTIEHLQNALSWQNGIILFDNVTLAEAIHELSRYSTRKITISDPEIANRTLYGAVPTNDMDAFIRVARNIMGLSVITDGENILIKSKTKSEAKK